MGILTVPNLLTFSRLAALPVVIVLARSDRPIAAAIVFAVAMLTDSLDGILAKRLDQRSVFGLYLDPVVDKIVILSLFYHLALVGTLWPALAHLLLVRELLQNGVRSVAASQGTIVGDNWMGKTKAPLQSVLITWGLLMPVLAPSPDDGGAIQVAFHASAGFVLALTWCFLAVFVHRNRHLLSGRRTASDRS